MPQLPSTATRRSTRLQKQSKTVPKETNAIDIPVPVKSRKRKRSVSVLASSSVLSSPCSEDKPESSSATTLRRSNRLLPTEIVQREKELMRKEQACELRAKELDQRCLLLGKREEDAQLMLSRFEEEQAKNNLALLEEHFTCPLCYDILARPFCLEPCGHTFCAICSLKWFFSKLHKACGGWHESVSCPTCRSLLILTPHDAPRKDITFPFVPNRTATDVLEDITSKLAKSPIQVKKEEQDMSFATQDCTGGVSNTDPSSGLAGWKEGGAVRQDWLKKCSDGKDEMNFLKNNWSSLTPQEFVMVKQRLA